MATNVDEFIGKKFGTCIIHRPLKAGGQGYSFLAFDAEIQKERVVKISKIKSSFDSEDDWEIESFKREGIILSRLRHPQVVDMIEQGEAYGYRYMIIDFINGYDFNKILKMYRAKQEELNCPWSKILNPLTALSIVASALEPLAYVHQVKIKLPGEGLVEGLAHRDISPGNLMLGIDHEYEGVVHMIDFGIARTNFKQSMTLNTQIIGTIKYMSPMRLLKKEEQTKNNIFWKSFKQTQHDVHSMGCFLYELLTGYSHINNKDYRQNLMAICDEATYKKLYKDIKVFHPLIQLVIKKSIIFPNLEKNKFPNQYQNAGEMLEEVKRVFEILSGGAETSEVLKELAANVENPQQIVRILNENTSKILKAVNRTPDNIGLRDVKKIRRLSFVGALVGLLAVGGLAKFLMQDKNLSQNQTVGQISGESNEKKEVLPVGGLKNAAPNKPASKKPLVKKVPKALKATPVLTEEQQSYEKALTLIQSGDATAAYKLINQVLQNSQDPAFYLLKAELIKRRNPGSPQLTALMLKAQNRSSKFMTADQLSKRWMNIARNN